MRPPLLEIVANIADRSPVRQIATDRTIKKSYDPVWLWLYEHTIRVFIGLRGMLALWTVSFSQIW